MNPLNRRRFITGSMTMLGASVLAQGPVPCARAAAPSRYKAAIIGHTGRGNFGHEHDLIFNDRPNIDVVAVADPDPAGRAKAAQRSHAACQYADYREMLEKERPQLVCIAPRWTDQHYAMGMAALQIGAHLYMEKPFTQTLAEADDLLELANAQQLKIVVAHQMSLAPSSQFLKTSLKDGLIGELLQIHAHGKQDRRAGGEDMIVLGTHLFDLMRFLAGEPLWCSARIRQSGREVTLQDARNPSEDIGRIIGDDIEAQFAFPAGVLGSFTSRAANRETAGPWGIELRGSKGVVRILTEISPQIYKLKPGAWSENGRTDQWEAIPDDPSLAIPKDQRGFHQANQRLVDDWLAAIAHNRPPLCSGYNAMKSLEMIMAVFQAGLTRSRVPIPLTHRGHPLRPNAKL